MQRFKSARSAQRFLSAHATREADRDGKTTAGKETEPPAAVREKRKGMDLEL